MHPSPPWQRLLDAVEAAWPAERYRQLGVVVGCSGGGDSVALAHALTELAHVAPAHETPGPRGFLVLAHYDHRLRGSDSAADAEFVRGLAARLNVDFELGHGTGRRADEQSLRRDRYRFFQQVLQRCGARYLALAHSLDDNVETVLHRLMRGTGPAGLAGMRPHRTFAHSGDGRDFVTARPMLELTRAQIREALRAQEYPWREDPSNARLHYQRNWIRHRLLPLMQAEFPEATAAIARAIAGQQDWADALQALVERWTETHCLARAPLTLTRLDRNRADAPATLQDAGSERAVVVEALRQCWQRAGWPLGQMNQSHWNALFDLLRGQGPAAISLPGGLHARRDANTVTVLRG
jgi:tRNA(Ile)-lysidine synthase